MKLSVVIVNYNVCHYLTQCLTSLYRAIGHDLEAEVFVVDNASSDGSQEYITKCFPQLTYIYNKENVGFACANNQAIRMAKGEYVLILNPDTLLPEDNLKLVMQFMDNHPDAGACGVKMLAPDGHFLPESKRGYPSPAASFYKIAGLHKLFPKIRKFDGYYLSYLSKETINEVAVLAGAYIMLRKNALFGGGMFDEDFFMYGEDIDLSCRITEQGLKNYYLPYPILHYKGESTKKDSYAYVRVFYDAMDIFFKKHGRKYHLLARQSVRLAIRLQKNFKYVLVALNKCKSIANIRRSTVPHFLIFVPDSSLTGVQNIIRRNKLDEKHHYVISSQGSTSMGHELHYTQTGRFTHVIYDSTAFSYKKIIELLEQNQAMHVEIGIYDPINRVLVTPEKSYE